MAPRYQIGQKVIISPAKSDTLSHRDAGLESYAGQTGTITDFYWINRGGSSEAFNIYTVSIEPDKKSLVLHEDELSGCVV